MSSRAVSLVIAGSDTDPIILPANEIQPDSFAHRGENRYRGTECRLQVQPGCGSCVPPHRQVGVRPRFRLHAPIGYIRLEHRDQHDARGVLPFLQGAGV